MKAGNSRWRFRPPLWASLAMPPVLAMLLGLGGWQLHRGQQKLALQAALEVSAAAAPVELRVSTPVPDQTGALPVVAHGRYDSERQLLLDNQTRERSPGYHVLTPLRLSSGGLVLVNRGWVPQNPDRQVLPELAVAAGEVSISGWWRPLPVPGLRLKVDNCTAQVWPKVVQYPTRDDLQCLFPQASSAAGMLLLEPEAADGYVREWSFSNGFPPQRHFGYAAQWFVFAATLSFLFIKLNLKRVHE